MFFDENARCLGLSSLPALHAVADLDLAGIHVIPQETQDDVVTLVYRNTYLHSPKAAVQEACTAFESLATPSADRVHVLIGLGLGYLLEKTFHNSPGRIVIYEPYPELLRFVMEHVNFTPYFSSERVVVTCDPQDLTHRVQQLLDQGSAKHLDVMILPGHASLLGEDAYSDLARRLYELEGQAIMDRHTFDALHADWLNHLLINTVSLEKTYPLDALKGLGEGQPCVLVGGGPSLEDSLDDLKTIANDVWVLAMGSALRTLLEAGIRPDFVAFADAHHMERQLNGLETQGLNLLLTAFAEPCSWQTPCAARWVMSTADKPEFHHWLEACYGDTLSALPGGGSVSVLGLHAARLLGCDPIILVGQDLSIQKQKLYSGGSAIRITADRVTLTEADGHRIDRMRMDIPGQRGETLSTTPNYYYFARQFSDIARQNAQSERPVHLINATPGGALIEGFHHCALHQALPTPHDQLSKLLLPMRPPFGSALPRTCLNTLADQCRQLQTLTAQLAGMGQYMTRQTRLPGYWEARRQWEALIAEAPLLRYAIAAHWLDASVQPTGQSNGNSINASPLESVDATDRLWQSADSLQALGKTLQHACDSFSGR